MVILHGHRMASDLKATAHGSIVCVLAVREWCSVLT